MLQSINGFLCQSFYDATLDDHRQLQRICTDDERPWQGHLSEFLGADRHQLHTEQISLPTQELPNVFRALDRAFRDWRLQETLGPARVWGTTWSPHYARLRIGPRTTKRFPIEATLLFELPSGNRRVLNLERDPPNATEVRLIGRRDQSRQLETDFRRLLRAVRRWSFLRGQVIGAQGRILANPQVTWEQIALPAGVKDLLQRNVGGILARGGDYVRNGVPQRRGVLLYGPPGTGKTMIGKALASQGQATFLWVTAADLRGDAERMRHIFHLARRLRPTILFFEDLDFFAADRRHSGASSVLGELLTQMDGLEKNDGLIVIGTTNDLEAIEPALKERPSRFDVVLKIGLPTSDARRQILQWQLGKCVLDPGVVEHAVEATQGQSGAGTREFAILMLQEAIFRGALDGAGMAQPGHEDIRAVAEKTNGRLRSPIGFRDPAYS